MGDRQNGDLRVDFDHTLKLKVLGSQVTTDAVQWTKLSCRTFKDNQTRLQLFALAYNPANFLRRLALPKSIRQWSLTTFGGQTTPELTLRRGRRASRWPVRPDCRWANQRGQLEFHAVFG